MYAYPRDIENTLVLYKQYSSLVHGSPPARAYYLHFSNNIAIPT